MQHLPNLGDVLELFESFSAIQRSAPHDSQAMDTSNAVAVQRFHIRPSCSKKQATLNICQLSVTEKMYTQTHLDEGGHWEGAPGLQVVFGLGLKN